MKISVNKSAPQPVSTVGCWQTASVSPCPGQRPQEGGQGALVTVQIHQARFQNKKTSGTRNNRACSKRNSYVAL